MSVAVKTKSFAAAVLAGALMFAAPALAGVGFQVLRVPDPEGGTIEVGVWYPADGPVRTIPMGLNSMEVSPGAPLKGEGLPLVVMSHGHGGFFGGHADTAAALAEAGFVTAALTHTGDNYADKSRSTEGANRPRQLRVLVDYMLGGWSEHGRLDPERVGAFGFSMGGFTVTAAIGGVPDAAKINEHCRQRPQFFDCQLVHHRPAEPASWTGWKRDDRIKAAVIAAPAVGYAFTPESLGAVKIPVQLWRAEVDAILPEPFYVQPVLEKLGARPEYHLVKKAGHFEFLTPCTPEGIKRSPDICLPSPGFDREAFHRDFNREVVRFLSEKLSVVNRP
ncbi:alpha/beta hydrolase family protein [Caulobacter sp. NIBR2454]|uniref:alpha/beta hydrolase family protein n=1 Tax=Caulobacter sp. NIBR2454 TaxID=3015996 RepID=UPI0022B5E971|nr:dienelactone hydrolase [Caulobacter sp. NIBR2454]